MLRGPLRRHAAASAHVAYRGRRAWGRTILRPVGRRKPADIIDAVRRWRAPAEDVVVLVEGAVSLRPAIVELVAPGAPLHGLVLPDDPRRRLHFEVGPCSLAPAGAVIKVARGEGEAGRAAQEQRHLQAVRGLGEPVARRVPRPLGHGTIRGRTWAAEALVPGRPLRRSLPWWRRRHGWRCLEELSAWLRCVAVASAHPAPANGASDRVLLRGEPLRQLGDLRRELVHVVAVYAHGDLASGENVLVAGRGFHVIDWETACADALPLLDLVPAVALATAYVAGARRAQDVAEVALQLCLGRHPRSRWYFDEIDLHLRALGLSTALAGPLATLAWGHQASMRERQAELLEGAHAGPREWCPPAELVYERWMAEPTLGSDWAAFRDADASRSS